MCLTLFEGAYAGAPYKAVTLGVAIRSALLSLDPRVRGNDSSFSTNSALAYILKRDCEIGYNLCATPRAQPISTEILKYVA